MSEWKSDYFKPWLDAVEFYLMGFLIMRWDIRAVVGFYSIEFSRKRSYFVGLNALSLRCTAVKTLLVELWFERNQWVFHDKSSSWNGRLEYARLKASSWCSLFKVSKIIPFKRYYWIGMPSFSNRYEEMFPCYLCFPLYFQALESVSFSLWGKACFSLVILI